MESICDFAKGVWGSVEEPEQERMGAKGLEMPFGCLQMEKGEQVSLLGVWSSEEVLKMRGTLVCSCANWEFSSREGRNAGMQFLGR